MDLPVRGAGIAEVTTIVTEQVFVVEMLAVVDREKLTEAI